MDPILVSTAEACRALGIGKTTLYELINSGQLSTKRVGRRRFVFVASIREFAEAA